MTKTSTVVWSLIGTVIVELDFARFSELHDILRGNNDVNIEIDGR